MEDKVSLLFSEEVDLTTDYVIDWFLSKEKNYKINVNDFNIIDKYTLKNNKSNLKIDGFIIDDIKSIWFRRGKLNFKLNVKYNDLNRYLKGEENVLLKPIEKELKKKVNLVGSYINEIENNKLKALIVAKTNGLNIPKSLITSSKEELQKFYNKNKSIITKDLFHPVLFKIKDITYSSVGTILVNQKMINICKENFVPIFLQKRIDKKYEIRIFHYKKKLFPMAIFSQNDKKTTLDYRNYNDEKPNRNVPVIIPKKIENKIFKMIKQLKLRTCSIDFIVSKNNKYFFLEVNPMGQLDWVSKNCNYYIEKQIAEDLMA